MNVFCVSCFLCAFLVCVCVCGGLYFLCVGVLYFVCVRMWGSLFYVCGVFCVCVCKRERVFFFIILPEYVSVLIFFVYVCLLYFCG